MQFGRVALVVLGLVFFLGRAAFAWGSPNTIQVTHPPTGAQAQVRVTQQLLAFPGLCTTLYWETDNIESLHLNDQGRIGVDDQRVCPVNTATLPTLYVDTLDGETLVLSPRLVLLLDGVLAWGVALMLAALGMSWLLSRRVVALSVAGVLAASAAVLGWLLRANPPAAWVAPLMVAVLAIALGVAAARPARTTSQRTQLLVLLLLGLVPLMTGYSVVYGFWTAQVDWLATVANWMVGIAAVLVVAVGVAVWRIPADDIRRHFNNALVVAFGGVLALLLLEGGLRLLSAAPTPDDEVDVMRVGMAMAEHGMSMPPNYTWRQYYPSNPDGYLLGEGYMEYVANNVGFRDKDFTPEPTPGVQRIALIGDSFALGTGVHEPDIAANIIEQQLTEVYDCPTEVYNFALGGQDILGYNQQLNSIVLQYKPDMVLVWYFLNDIGLSHAAFLEDTADRRSPFFPIMQPHLRLFQLSADSLLYYTRSERGIQSFHETYADPSEWGVVDTQLEAIATTMQDYGAPYALFVHPILFRLGRYPYAGIHDQLLSTASDYGYVTADLYPPLAGYPYTDLWAHPIDSHPNALAHRLTGEYAAAQLAPALGCPT